MSQDRKTLGFYAQEADVYTARGRQPDLRHIEAFLALLPAGAGILELGCGAGQDSEFMIARGFKVRPTDGTPEIAAAAERRLGIPVATLLFGDLREEATCDGIWANACLLHVPRADLAGVLARIHAALKKGGVFYASFKSGQADGRDKFDRYYNYPSEAWLRDAYGLLPWSSVTMVTDSGIGYDQKSTDWLHVTAIKP